MPSELLVHTPLDDRRPWFLDAIVWQEGELRILLVEGIVSGTAEDVPFGDKFVRNARRVEPTERSLRYEVRFENCVAWQVVDESWWGPDDDESRPDPHVIRTLERSRYFDYVRASYGLYEQVVGPAKAFRVNAIKDIIEVVGFNAPTIERLERVSG